MNERVKVRIGRDGSIKVEAVGVKGGGCKKLTEPFEKALGRAAKVDLKPEFNMEPDLTQPRSQS